MPADWSVTPQDQASIVITPASYDNSIGWMLGVGQFNTSTAWPTASKAIYIPFTVSVPTTIIGGGTYNGSAVSGNFDVGIYDDQQNQLVHSGSTAQSGTSAWQVVTLTSTTLDPGIYYMALALDNTTGTVLGYTNTFTSMNRAFGIYQQTSAFVLPNPAVFAVNATGFIPIVALTTRTWI